MTRFELRFLDTLEVPVGVRVFSAHDDLSALREAERLCEKYAVEVWDGDRRVARVKKNNAPLKTEDHQSL